MSLSQLGFDLVLSKHSRSHRCGVRVRRYLQWVLSGPLGFLALGWHILCSRQHRRGCCRQEEAMGVSGSSFMVNSHGHCWGKKRKREKKRRLNEIQCMQDKQKCCLQVSTKPFPNTTFIACHSKSLIKFRDDTWVFANTFKLILSALLRGNIRLLLQQN